MNMLKLPPSCLVPLLHDWVPLKQTVVVNTAFCNHFDRRLLENVLKMLCKLGSVQKNILSNINIVSKFRQLKWNRTVITGKNTARKRFGDDFLPAFKLDNLEEISFYSAEICISHFLSLTETHHVPKYRHEPKRGLILCGFVQRNPHKQGHGIGVNGSYRLAFGTATYFGEMKSYTLDKRIEWHVEGKGEMFSKNLSMCEFGEWKNGMLHGMGKSWQERDGLKTSIRTGQFVEGKLTGDGTYQQKADSLLQIGQFLENKCVYGQIHYPNGAKYSGEMKGESYCVTAYGKGEQIQANGDKFTGNFLSGQFSGMGVMEYANGNHYSGLWENSSRHGIGKLICADGAVYEGNWVSNAYHGTGVLTSSNDDVYTGTFSAGKKSRTGEMKYANGDTYSGQWYEDKYHNSGALTLITGALYHGGFSEGLFHGMGTLLSANGDVYIGMWREGLRNGQGTLKPCIVDKSVIIGVWNQDFLEKTVETRQY